MWTTIIFSGTAAVFLGMTLTVLWHIRWLRRLPPLSASPAPAGERQIRRSVVIAARDEEARIETTIRHLLGQAGDRLEIIAVDDRSGDHTGPILARLAREDSRLRIVRIDALPDAWLGKCHASHIGASEATSERILFADADSWLTPDMIARAVRRAECEGADHITLSSGLATKTLGLRASHLIFLMRTANWFPARIVTTPKVASASAPSIWSAPRLLEVVLRLRRDHAPRLPGLSARSV
jgi:glycosyltransferase involved in cell wall biosynthesis